jgi:PQQ-like domain
MRRAPLGLVLVLLAALTVPAAAAAPITPSVRVDWPTYHGDAARSGYAPSMPAVSGQPRVVHQFALDGAVYASPIVVGGVTIVATENNSVYAFDAGFHRLWRRHLGAPSPAGERPCGNIDPLGITGTPVYDAAHNAIDVAAELGGPPRHALYSLSITTGVLNWVRNLDLPGVETVAMQERGALAVTGGRVWVPFGGLSGDCGGYKGRVVGIALDGSGPAVAYTVPTTREAGIWATPGPVVNSDGTLYVSVGNGEAGVGDPYDHSDSVLRLDANAQLLGYFAPTTWATDNQSDLDLGSMGPALVGTRWVFAAGKSGNAYVLKRYHLGGIGGEVSQAPLCRAYGGSAVVGTVVYVPCTDGVRAVNIDSVGSMHPVWQAVSSRNGSPVVGGGRVWTLDPVAGVLWALDPATGQSTGSVSVGAANRFASPAISGKFVLVPTLTGLTVVATS